jgi:spore germination protein
VNRLTKRDQVRAVSYTLCAIAVLCGAAVYQYHRAEQYRQAVEASYQRAFYDLVDYVKTVDATLEKGIHTSSVDRLVELSNRLWAEAGSAKAAMGQLPLSSVQMDQLSRFMSQVGDYTLTVALKAARGEEPSAEQQATLDTLSQYASSLSGALGTMEQQVNDGELTVWEIRSMTRQSQDGLPALADAFSQVEGEFVDLPTLVYDGPYSDHMSQRESVFLKDQPVVSEQQAQERAAQLLGVSPEECTMEGAGEGNMPTFSFVHEKEDGQRMYVEITQQGGYPLSLLNSRTVGEIRLSHDGAARKAEEFLLQQGFTDLRQRYALQRDGVLTLSYAAMQHGYTCYPDLVEIGVALDDGEIVFLQSGDYLMNHHQREIEPPAISRAEAEQSLNSRLTPVGYELAVIPRPDGSEVVVHGFLCTNQEDRKYLVYINAQTGREEELLLLVEDDNGSLAM